MSVITRSLGAACVLLVVAGCSTDGSPETDAGTDTEFDGTLVDVPVSDTGEDTADDAGDAGDLGPDVADTAEDVEPDIFVGTPTLSDISERIFNVSCAVVGCHVGTRPEGDLDLSDAPGLMDRLRAESLLGYRYIDDTTRDSHLYLLITGREQEIFGAPGFMPPEEEGGPLADHEIDLVRRWIEAGAPE